MEEQNTTEAAPVTEQAPVEQAPAPAPEPAVASIPLDSIPEKFRSNPEQLVQSYTELESQMGRRMPMPTEDSSQEVWNEFNDKVLGTGKFIPKPTDEEGLNDLYNQLGRPESPEQYDLGIPDEASQYFNQNDLNIFKELAHQNGLNQKAVKAFAEFEAGRVQKHLEAAEGMANEARQKLEQEWGAEYDTRLGVAEQALSTYQDKFPEYVQQIAQSPLRYNPVIRMALAELGQQMREDGHIPSQPGTQFGTSASEAKEKLNEIMGNNQHPYFTEADPKRRAEIVAEVNRLHQISLGER